MNDARDSEPIYAAAKRKRQEMISFFFLSIFLAPAIAVAFVGALGLSIWVYQLIVGPPGPPA